MKVKSKHLILSLVCLVLGFMISFSYKQANEEEETRMSEKSWDRDFQLRKKLVEQEEKTRELQKQLIEKQTEITSVENELAKEARSYSSITKEAGRYRLHLGKVKTKGGGIEVTLQDGDFKTGGDVNDYLVHEQHVFKVINELYVSGAQAAAINGQRLTRKSYIVCDGPVIVVDGIQHPAPFVISAIGDPKVMGAALNIAGGIKDQLVNENIVFTLEEKEQIVMEPVFGSS
ncbi:DUF881 domain-containing protein [Peribacillus sp. SCS-26]|uniref:DUF881 domain-containing protein n=1 Tax=Paraperibacillus marinus TaxID=3115295 RepID=UPI003905DF50